MDHMGFDPASMNYVATAMQQPGGVDPYSEMLLQPPMVEHQSIYGFAGYVMVICGLIVLG
jgi:hypothetical protein